MRKKAEGFFPIFSQSYWDWLPPEIQEHIVSLACWQHMRDLKSNQPLFNLLLREIHDHHTLTIAINEGLDEYYRGSLLYIHTNFDVICPNHICTSHHTSYSRGCSGDPDCFYNHSTIYFMSKCGGEWFLGYNFHNAHKNLKSNKSIIASHACGRPCSW